MRFVGSQLGQLRRYRATVPAGSPAVSPTSPVLSDSVASLAHSGSPASSVLSDSVAEGLNTGQQAVLDCIKAHEGINVPPISELTNIPSKSIERHISALIARNLIEHRGCKKTGGYYAR